MALIYWGLILIFGGETNYNKTLTIIIISAVPAMISNLVKMFYTLITKRTIINKGLSGLIASGNLITDSTNPIYIILSKIDIFILWGLILLVLGFVISCKMKVWKSILIAVLLFILGIIVVLIATSISKEFIIGGTFIPKSITPT